ncbi:MAG: DUF2817 domain-containing protein [Methylococcaceae bacterium]
MKKAFAKQVFIKMSMCFALSTTVASAKEVDLLCQKLSLKLSSIRYEDCHALNYSLYKTRSRGNTPLLIKELKPATHEKAPKILFIAGIHGDEYSSVSATFKWLKVLESHHRGKFHWLFLPLINPDGLLRKTSQRMNAKGIDLNRNFPPFGHDDSISLAYWNKEAKKDPRRYPGNAPLSEPETKAIVEIIGSFKPDVIVSVHAPYNLLDFDGKKDADAPQKLGSLALQLLGTYPGSLGNYAWLKLKIPVITLELPNADVMPAEAELNNIWMDLVAWLKVDFPKTRVALNNSTGQSAIMKN